MRRVSDLLVQQRSVQFLQGKLCYGRRRTGRPAKHSATTGSHFAACCREARDEIKVRGWKFLPETSYCDFSLPATTPLGDRSCGTPRWCWAAKPGLCGAGVRAEGAWSAAVIPAGSWQGAGRGGWGETTMAGCAAKTRLSDSETCSADAAWQWDGDVFRGGERDRGIIWAAGLSPPQCPPWEEVASKQWCALWLPPHQSPDSSKLSLGTALPHQKCCFPLLQPPSVLLQPP